MEHIRAYISNFWSHTHKYRVEIVRYTRSRYTTTHTYKRAPNTREQTIKIINKIAPCNFDGWSWIHNPDFSNAHGLAWRSCSNVLASAASKSLLNFSLTALANSLSLYLRGFLCLLDGFSSFCSGVLPISVRLFSKNYRGAVIEYRYSSRLFSSFDKKRFTDSGLHWYWKQIDMLHCSVVCKSSWKYT